MGVVRQQLAHRRGDGLQTAAYAVPQQHFSQYLQPSMVIVSPRRRFAGAIGGGKAATARQIARQEDDIRARPGQHLAHEPVSYTHLDVYKRQALLAALCPDAFAACGAAVEALRGAGIQPRGLDARRDQLLLCVRGRCLSDGRRALHRALVVEGRARAKAGPVPR